MLQRAKPDAAPGALSRIGSRFWSWPAIVFALLSLFFGSVIIVINPPLRGPDEISHFLRIYSYTRGELLPVIEINGRKGIFVERELYERLHFFKDRGGWFASLQQQQHKGDWFARYRDEGARYGQVMGEYHDIIGARDDETEQRSPDPQRVRFDIDLPLRTDVMDVKPSGPNRYFFTPSHAGVAAAAP